MPAPGPAAGSRRAGRAKATQKQGDDPKMAVRQLLDEKYTDVFEAFTDMDLDNDGRLSLSEFIGGIQQLGQAGVTEEQLDELFVSIDTEKTGYITVREWLAAFQKKATAKAAEQSEEGDSKFRMRSANNDREFEEVLMECKDDRGVQKFIAVPAQMTWADLLLKLRGKYGRPVTFMYEADGRPYTVKEEKDYKMCWDSVEEAFKRAGGAVGHAAHLEAFVVDLDPTKFAASTRPKPLEGMLRASLVPKRVTLVEGEKGKVGGRTAASAAAAGRKMVAPVDFESKHKWIDEMMRSVGATEEQEPTTMRGKWEKLGKECAALDATRSGALSAENFRKALQRCEAKMAPAQFDWFVRDADKDAQGRVLYEKYVASKRAGLNVAERHQLQDGALLATEAKINEGMRLSFRSLQQAFKKLDVDKDGALSKAEFKNGIEQRLKIRLAPKLFDAIFRRCDADGDGVIGFSEFLSRFKAVPSMAAGADGNHDALSDVDVCKALLQGFGTVADAFTEMDTDRDGRVNRDELLEGLEKVGVRMSQGRLDALLDSFDTDGNRQIDYREFLRQVSKVGTAEVDGKMDELAREEARIRDKMRESYAEAKQAFHAFDKDHDGRLSEAEFVAGVSSLFTDGSSAIKEGLQHQLFHRSDMDGDGYLAYHEFLARYGVKPRMRKAISVDNKIRDALRKKYPTSSMQAFQALDIDQDNLLSRADLEEGLKQIGLDLRDDEIASLLQRADFNADSHLDYYEFIVRFGLEFEPEGKWVYKTEDKQFVSKDPEEVKIWRKLMPPSKWFGRGGIAMCLERYDADRDGRLDRREFVSALKDGLGMAALTNQDVDALLGPNVDKPWCDKASKTVLAEKFFKEFVEQNFAKEMTLFNVLLVRNRWLDLKHAMESMDTTPPNATPMISEADFRGALQRMVEQNLIDMAEKDMIFQKVKADALFEKDGATAGHLSYLHNFLGHYISDEMTIFQVVFPRWEQFASKFSSFGGSLTYTVFRDVCKKFHFGTPLTSSQIEALIDVLDQNGDGRVDTSEFIARYARDDAVLLQAVRKNWLPLMQSFSKARKPSMAPKCLAKPDVQHCILRAIEAKQLDPLAREQVPAIVANLDPSVLNERGELRYEDWIRKYAEDYFVTHMAFQGNHEATRLPKWDAVIACFEIIDSSVGHSPLDAERPEHSVGWDQFQRTLVRAGIVLDSAQVCKLIDDLDGNMSGLISWVDFVEGRDEEGDTVSSPYFFNGSRDLRMRRALRQHWAALLAACRKADVEKKVSISRKADVEKKASISRQDLHKALSGISAMGLADSPEGDAMVKYMVEVVSAAFGKEVDGVLQKAEDGFLLVDYMRMVQHYAGEAYGVEEQLKRKWDAIYAMFAHLDVAKSGSISLAACKKGLNQPELGLSRGMLDFLTKGLTDPVDYVTLIWHFARETIADVLKSKSVVLLRMLRAADHDRTGAVKEAQFRGACMHADVALTKFQVDLMFRHTPPDANGKIDYDRLLSGAHSGFTFAADLYKAWKALETSWQDVAEAFLSFDTNFDGQVSYDEFKDGLAGLRIPGLTDKKIIESVIKELDPDGTQEVQFDIFMWTMARDTLREDLRVKAAQVVDSFRSEAARLAAQDAAAAKKGAPPKHTGQNLTRKEAEDSAQRVLTEAELKALHVCMLTRTAQNLTRKEAEDSVRRVLTEAELNALLVRILVNKADRERRGMVLLDDFIGVLRMLTEDQIEAGDLELFREAILDVLQPNLEAMRDRWVEGGQPKSEMKAFSGVCPVGFPDNAAARKRGHMARYIESAPEELPLGMRPSKGLAALRKTREERMYRSAPWRAFWLERSRGAGDDGGRERAAMQKVRDNEFLVAQQRIRQKLTDAPSALLGGQGGPDANIALGKVELSKALQDLRVGLSPPQVAAVVAHATGQNGFVMYSDFMAMYGPTQPDYSKLAEERERSGFYSRLQASMRAREERDRAWKDKKAAGERGAAPRALESQPVNSQANRGHNLQPHYLPAYDLGPYVVQGYENEAFPPPPPM